MSQIQRHSDQPEAKNNGFRAIPVIIGVALLLGVIGMMFASAGPAHVTASSTYTMTQDVDPLVPSALARISWGAIIAGTLVAMMLQLALNLLGISVGAASLTPELNSGANVVDEAKPVGIGLAAWTAISVLVSLFVGGWIAARLAGLPSETDGMLHGIITWSLVTLLSIALLATGVGRILSGISGLIGEGLSLAGKATAAAASGAATVASSAVQGAANVASGAMQGASGVAQDAMQSVQGMMSQMGMGSGGIQGLLEEHVPEVAEAMQLQDLSFQSILHEAQRMMNEAGMNSQQMQGEAQGAMQDVREAASRAMQNPTEIDQTLELAMRRVMRRAQGVVDQADRESLLNMVMARTGMSPEQAMAQLNQWEMAYDRARHQVDQAREQAMQRMEQMRHDAEQKAEQMRMEAERKAMQAARATSQAIARAALAAFLAIVIGAVAAGIGGAVGAPETVPATIETTTGIH